LAASSRERASWPLSRIIPRRYSNGIESGRKERRRQNRARRQRSLSFSPASMRLSRYFLPIPNAIRLEEAQSCYLPRADSSLKAKGVLIWWPFYRRWSSSGDRRHWDGMLATLMSVRAFGSSVSGKVGFELRPKSPAGGVAFDPCHLEAAHAFSSQSSLRGPSQLVRTRRGSLVSRLRAD
jgi:hypothetical protein